VEVQKLVAMYDSTIFFMVLRNS